MSKEFDGAVRPVIGLAVAVILLGVAWRFWYIAVPVVVILVGLYLWLWLRNKARARNGYRR